MSLLLYGKLAWFSGRLYIDHMLLLFDTIIPAGIYFFKVNNENTRKMFKIYLKFTIKTAERRQWCRYGVSIVVFEQVNAGWDMSFALSRNRLLFANSTSK